MSKTRADADLERPIRPRGVRLLDLAAVMAELDLSESTVFRRVREGVLPAPVKVGPGAVRWMGAPSDGDHRFRLMASSRTD